MWERLGDLAQSVIASVVADLIVIKLREIAEKRQAEKKRPGKHFSS